MKPWMKVLTVNVLVAAPAMMLGPVICIACGTIPAYPSAHHHPVRVDVGILAQRYRVAPTQAPYLQPPRFLPAFTVDNDVRTPGVAHRWRRIPAPLG
jgi:hypothetical protein